MLERCRQDLIKEMAIRKDMEQKWNENKEEHKSQVNLFNNFCRTDNFNDK